MKKNKCLLSLIFLIISVCTKAQASQKSTTEDFEYTSALYYKSTEMILIDCRNSKGELVQFRYNKQDQSKTEELLFNPAGVTTEPVKIITKAELVGKKFKLTYNSTSAIDPSNPACCYKITAVTAL